MPGQHVCTDNNAEHAKNHNLASYVQFVDMVKAYDTTNHILLFDVLAKYGAPLKFIAAIK
jgi:hypothetical protein